MKKFMLLIPFCLLVANLQAQNVKVKKDIVYVDREKYLKTSKEYGNEIISNLKGNEIIKIEWVYYDAPNPARQNTANPARHNYPATIRKHYAVVTFLDFNITFETDFRQRRIFEALYNDKVIDENGNVIEENASSLAQKAHKNLSGNRPHVIVVY